MNKLKKIRFGLVISVVLIFFIFGCSPKTEPIQQTQTPHPEPKVIVAEETPITGESAIDEVIIETTSSDNLDDDLDTSELDSIDDLLSDIENI